MHFQAFFLPGVSFSSPRWQDTWETMQPTLIPPPTALWFLDYSGWKGSGNGLAGLHIYISPSKVLSRVCVRVQSLEFWSDWNETSPKEPASTVVCSRQIEAKPRPRSKLKAVNMHKNSLYLQGFSESCKCAWKNRQLNHITYSWSHRISKFIFHWLERKLEESK